MARRAPSGDPGRRGRRRRHGRRAGGRSGRGAGSAGGLGQQRGRVPRRLGAHRVGPRRAGSRPRQPRPGGRRLHHRGAPLPRSGNGWRDRQRLLAPGAARGARLHPLRHGQSRDRGAHPRARRRVRGAGRAGEHRGARLDRHRALRSLPRRPRSGGRRPRDGGDAPHPPPGPGRRRPRKWRPRSPTYCRTRPASSPGPPCPSTAAVPCLPATRRRTRREPARATNQNIQCDASHFSPNRTRSAAVGAADGRTARTVPNVFVFVALTEAVLLAARARG